VERNVPSSDGWSTGGSDAKADMVFGCGGRPARGASRGVLGGRASPNTAAGTWLSLSVRCRAQSKLSRRTTATDWPRRLFVLAAPHPLEPRPRVDPGRATDARSCTRSWPVRHHTAPMAAATAAGEPTAADPPAQRFVRLWESGASDDAARAELSELLAGCELAGRVVRGTRGVPRRAPRPGQTKPNQF